MTKKAYHAFARNDNFAQREEADSCRGVRVVTVAAGVRIGECDFVAAEQFTERLQSLCDKPYNLVAGCEW